MHNRSISVIEDNDNFRAALLYRLELEGYTAQGSFGFEDFFASILRTQPDIVISDIDLGNENGFQVIHCLRAMGLNLPVILMTGSTELGLEKKAHEIGACAVLRKPFEVSQLLEAIQQA